MAVLNFADSLRLGSIAVDRVMCGSAEVWARDTGEPAAVATVTIPAGTVASDLTAFPVRLDLSHMPAGWWDDVATDGGNVRVKQAGAVIPFDVVGIDTATRRGELFFKANLSAASANVFTVDKTGSSALAATDANGRNAVWSGYLAVWVADGGLVNRTGGAAITETGTAPLYGIVGRSPNLAAHQGIAYDSAADAFIVIDTTSIKRYDRAWNLLNSLSNSVAPTGLSGVTHQSDGVVVAGELFVGMDNYPSFTVQHVAVYDAVTLSFKRSYNIIGSNRQVSGIGFDGTHFVTVGYNAGTNVATSIDRWSTSWGFDSSLTTATLANKQGIAYHDGYYWITLGSAEAIHRVNLDGTGATLATQVDLPFLSGSSELEGITSDGTDLFMLYDHGSAEHVYRLAKQGAGGYGRMFDGRNYLKATGLTKLTTWTYGVTSFLGRDTVNSRNHALMAYSTNNSTNANQASLVADEITGSPDRYGIWNSTDTWLYDTSVEVQPMDRYRMHHTQNGTTDRKIARDGIVRATDIGTAQRPASTGDTFFIGTGNTGATENWYGWLDRAYLRSGVPSDAWLAAEFTSWETPASFYTVT